MIDTNKQVVYGQAPPRKTSSIPKRGTKKVGLGKFCYRCWIESPLTDPEARLDDADHWECPRIEDIWNEENQKSCNECKFGGRVNGVYTPGIRQVPKPAFRREYLTEDDMSENR